MSKNEKDIKKAIIQDLVKQTGWTYQRARMAFEELENKRLIVFPSDGGVGLKVIGKVGV